MKKKLSWQTQQAHSGKEIRITLVNETQIGESESASEIYLCFKVIISAPFINVITADSANRRRVIL